VVEFGAFVNFFGARDGLVHISQLIRGRPATVGEVVSEGQEVWVKLLGFDDRGKVRLSMKAVDQTTGQEIPLEPGEADTGGGGGHRRDRDGGGRRDRGEHRERRRDRD
jgi:polyribonucleotide nucleotidyltransferase